MPRYLGINYQSAILEGRRRMLASNLLTVPTHLDKVEHYAHQGITGSRVGDHQRPWQTVCLMSFDDDKSINEDMQCLLSQFQAERIVLDENSQTEGEFVSLCSFQSSVHSRCDLIPVSCDDEAIESTLAPDHHRERLARLPSIVQLLQYLKVEIIQDPLLSTNPHALRCLEQFGEFAQPLVAHQELFIVEEPLALMYELEEVISHDVFNHPNLFKADCKEIIADSPSTENVYENLKQMSSLCDLNSIESTFSSQSSCDLYSKAEGWTKVQLSTTTLPEFECPLAMVATRCLERPWLQLCAEDVEFRTDDIIQLKQEYQVCLQNMQSENYMDDYDSLSLVEPSLVKNREDLLSYIRPHSAIKNLGLNVDKNVIDIELSLPWDPLSVSLREAHLFHEIEYITGDSHGSTLIANKIPVEPLTWCLDSPSIVTQSQQHQQPTLLNPRQAWCSIQPQCNDVDPFKRFLSLRQHGSRDNDIPGPLKDNAPGPDRAIPNQSDSISHATDNSLQCEIVKVPLSDSYQHIVDLLESYAKPLLGVLCQHKMIPSMPLHALSSDLVKFTFKQMLVTAKTQKSNVNNELLQTSLIVYLLCHTTRHVLHSSLHSAILQLSALFDEYCQFLNASDFLSEVRHRLFLIHCQFQQNKTLHPKVHKLCSILAKWSSSSRQDQDKAVVIVENGLISLVEQLNDAVSMVPGIEVHVSSNQTHHVKKYNCLISFHEELSESQLTQFSLVVDYDCQSSSQQCFNAKQKFIGLQTVPPTLQDHTFNTALPVKQVLEDCIHNVAITSQKVYNNCQLMRLLETRHSLTLVDRDYEKISLAIGSVMHFEDIALDVSTCIVLQDILDLSNNEHSRNLLMKIAALSIKFENCWVILHLHDTQSKLLNNSMILNIAKFQAAVSVLDDNVNECNPKVVLSMSVEDTGEIIGKIANTRKNGIDMNWITREPTQMECFLLSFPCLNSVSAQILMHSLPKNGDLLTMYVTQLADSYYPLISNKVLQMFHKMSHSGCRLVDDVTLQCKGNIKISEVANDYKVSSESSKSNKNQGASVTMTSDSISELDSVSQAFIGSNASGPSLFDESWSLDKTPVCASISRAKEDLYDNEKQPIIVNAFDRKTFNARTNASKVRADTKQATNQIMNRNCFETNRRVTGINKLAEEYQTTITQTGIAYRKMDRDSSGQQTLAHCHKTSQKDGLVREDLTKFNTFVHKPLSEQSKGKNAGETTSSYFSDKMFTAARHHSWSKNHVQTNTSHLGPVTSDLSSFRARSSDSEEIKTCRRPEVACVVPLVRHNKPNMATSRNIAVPVGSTCTDKYVNICDSSRRSQLFDEIASQDHRNMVLNKTAREPHFDVYNRDKSGLVFCDTEGIQDHRNMVLNKTAREPHFDVCNSDKFGLVFCDTEVKLKSRWRPRDFENSPPVDLDSDEEQLSSWVIDVAMKSEENKKNHRKRKLTYDKECVLVGGQTRLKFM